MTLERHQSRLIPNVTLDLGGRILVTDGEGTFPLSHPKRRNGLPDFKDANHNDVPMDDSDLRSFRSYDPKRERKFQPRESNYQREINNISGTMSSGGSKSLQRKLKKHRTHRDTSMYEVDGKTPRFGTLNLTGTMSDRGRRRSRNPQNHDHSNGMPYPGSLNRKKIKQTMNFTTLKRKSTLRSNSKSKEEVYTGSKRNSLLSNTPSETVNVRLRKFAEEKLPGIVFLVDGLIMLLLAILKLMLSWWTSYWTPLYTAVLLICLGVIGRMHRGDYFTKWKNGAYIIVAFLSLISALVSIGLLLWVTAPMLAQLGAQVPNEGILASITQTNVGRSLVGSITGTSATPINVGLDMALIVLCLVSLYSLTASQMALSNHWDAVYTVTGDVDHRGNPRVFNPLEQSIVGMCTVVFGLLAINFTQYPYSVYGTPVIAGAIIIIAGMVAFIYGKRPDKLVLASISLVVEVIALVVCAVSVIFLTLALVSDVKTASNPDSIKNPAGPEPISTAMQRAIQGQAIASIVFISLYYITMVVNVVFAAGLIFRGCRKSCCMSADSKGLLNDSRI